tara:strand:- start:8731 stop:9357 length:627 start_codon:yes stop_codon:yes gene_type:complete
MRQNSNARRSRGRGNRKSGNGRNQVFDSNGPGARVRGNSSQIYEKYQQLARDAFSSGDRVAAEGYYQHAEHYYRLMEATNSNRENSAQDQSQSQSQPQGDNASQNNKTVDTDVSIEKKESSADYAPESVAALIEAVEKSNSDNKDQDQKESEELKTAKKREKKPQKRTRSRGSNGSTNGKDNLEKETTKNGSEEVEKEKPQDIEPVAT